MGGWGVGREEASRGRRRRLLGEERRRWVREARKRRRREVRGKDRRRQRSVSSRGNIQLDHIVLVFRANLHVVPSSVGRALIVVRHTLHLEIVGRVVDHHRGVVSGYVLYLWLVRHWTGGDSLAGRAGRGSLTSCGAGSLAREEGLQSEGGVAESLEGESKTGMVGCWCLR